MSLLGLRHTMQVQKGISLTECIILLWILIPLSVIIPSFAKFIDFNLTMPQSIRYLGWHEALTGVTLTPENAHSHVLERILKNEAIQIKTEQAISQDQYRQFWRQSHGNRSSLLSNDEAQFSAIVSDHGLDHSITTSTMELTSAALNVQSGESFHGVNANARATQLRIRLNPLNLGLNTCDQSNPGLCLQQHHVIYWDTLAASGSDQVISQVNSLKPAVRYAPVARIFGRLAHGSYIFREGSALQNTFLHVSPDVVPAHALSNTTSR